MGTSKARLHLLVISLLAVGSPALNIKNIIDSAGDEFRSATCGSTVEKVITTADEIDLDASYLASRGELPAGCEITWRIALELAQDQKAENYGISVTGDVSIEDPENDDSCLSSEVQVTDFEGDEADSSAVTQRSCGTKSDFDFVTYQDVILVHLTVSAGGASGSGFKFHIKPFYACGGLVKLGRTLLGKKETTIKSPGFNKPYPSNMLCMWSFTFPPASQGYLQCEYFMLPRKKNRKCRDNLRVLGLGTKSYCAGKLKKDTKISLGSRTATVIFRSDETDDQKSGFQCRVFYE